MHFFHLKRDGDSVKSIRARSTCLSSALIVALMTAPSVHAESTELERRVAELENRLEADANPLPAVKWSGLLEVEAGAGDDFAGEDSSDIVLATVELAADARINEYVSTHLLLLFEEETPEDVEIDEGAISFAHPDSDWGATFGRVYVPFGAFETVLVSDPLPLELGETLETVAMVEHDAGSFYGAVYAFNGDTSDGGDSMIEEFGLNVGLRGEGDGLHYDVGAGYLSSLGDSDALSLANVEDRVGSFDVYTRIATGPFTLMAEYVTATDAFQPAELAFGGGGAEPAAFQLELAHDFGGAELPATASVSVQGTDEAVALGLPETRFLAGVSVEPWAATSVSLEWAHDEDYDTADGGTGNSADMLTLQLAAEF